MSSTTRTELNARIKTFKDCLPETRAKRSRFDLWRERDGRVVPAEDFDLKKVNEQISALEVKRRKLNSAVQKANLQEQIGLGEEMITLAEALELRKSPNERLGELHTRVIESAYWRVIYKEDRDIIEPAEVPFQDSLGDLEEARLAFRELNRKIRAASFTVSIDFFIEDFVEGNGLYCGGGWHLKERTSGMIVETGRGRKISREYAARIEDWFNSKNLEYTLDCSLIDLWYPEREIP